MKIAEESSREYREAGEQLRAAKVTHEMQLELFAALRSGTWTEKEQHEKLPSLKDYLQSIALEKTLVATAEGLKTSPDARGGFDQMAIDCIAQELGEKMKALEEQLLHRAPAERQLEASLLGLQALADVCDQKAQAALAAHQLVEEKMKGFTSSIKALKQQVVKHAKQLESSTERLKAEQVKVSAFQEATAALEHLRAEAEAPATQPAPVPEPLTEPVAMDTASPTAEGEVPPAKRLRMEGAPLPPALVASPARIRS